MSNEATTRARILEVAMDLFGTHGYHRTSVRAIAEQLGISKAGVLYHYPSKYDILAGLAEPLLVAMEGVVAEAGHPDPCEARRRVVEGLLDVFLTHRYLLRLNVRDLALAAPGSIFERFSKVMMQANILVAGPEATFAERVRATQAVAGLSDPVVLYAEAPVDQLRAEVLEGVRLLLAPSDRTSSTDRTPTAAKGRPAALTAERIELARRMRDTERRSVPDIARELGVSRATLYRYLK
ncbi:TetR family transcriptional regulator [Nocardia niwae]|uniref:TetR family transcriptional regulator n=1 Tax=Nocardia niwae TaxID=626084 RepID=UPI000AFF5A2B|nr:TetR family transcriptional regulator [Nocardia niwae]